MHPLQKVVFQLLKKGFRIKLEYFSSTKLLIPIVRMYGFKLEGGEWFKEGFHKLFKVE